MLLGRAIAPREHELASRRVSGNVPLAAYTSIIGMVTCSLTALGTDAPNVVGLVYVAAFGLDEGESLGVLQSQLRPLDRL